MGPREGPVSAPAWPFGRTRFDRLKFGGLIAAGNFLHRYVDEIRIEKDDSKKDNKSTTPVGKSHKGYKSCSAGKLLNYGLLLRSVILVLGSKHTVCWFKAHTLLVQSTRLMISKHTRFYCVLKLPLV